MFHRKFMSENKEISENDFDVFDKISKKYFSEIEHSVPHIQQVLFDLQNEYYKTWKNAVNSNISLQKEFLTTSGLNQDLSDSVKTVIETMGEEAVKYREYSNKMILANIESAKKNVKTLNDSADIFVDLNQKIMHYWLSVFLPKRN